MKLILIYGPPAAGKYTVGSEIARLMGYKLFHNHVSIDYVKSVFEFGTPQFWDAIRKVRYALIGDAAGAGIDLIHTFCYEFGVDDEQFAALIATAEDNGGEVHLVLLVCDDEERRKRITNDSRVRLGKLTDPNAVGRKDVELTTPYPGRETLVLDTTAMPAADTAERIVDHFGLRRQGPS